MVFFFWRAIKVIQVSVRKTKEEKDKILFRNAPVNADRNARTAVQGQRQEGKVEVEVGTGKTAV